MTQNPRHEQPVAALISAVLVGGPVGFPAEWRHRTVDAAETKIKLPYLNGWEHFERQPVAESGGPLPFHWTMSTKIAE